MPTPRCVDSSRSPRALAGLSLPTIHSLNSQPRLRWALGLSALALSVAALVACGGGGSDTAGATSTTPTSSAASAYTAGTVTGFGSVIVNGVRFDDGGVQATDETGAHGTVKLGMQVEVQSDAIDTGKRSARAHAMSFRSQLVGPVAEVGSSTLTVLGQVIDVTEATVFDSSLAAGISAVAVGAVVEVHGVPDTATGHLVATRIEAKTDATSYKLRGTVASLDTTAQTFAIGGAVISYAGVGSVPSTLADGITLRVVLSTTPNAAGQWLATALGSGKSSTTTPTTGQAAHVHGTITSFTASTRFTVAGLVVDASAISASLPSGLAAGVEVDVDGTVSNGVLVASAVTLRAEARGHDDHRFQLIGAISNLDTNAKTFVVRGVTVDYSAASYVGGTEASLADSVSVTVSGTAGERRHHQIKATTITFGSTTG